MRKRAELRSRHSVLYGASHVGWTAIGLRDSLARSLSPGSQIHSPSPVGLIVTTEYYLYPKVYIQLRIYFCLG